MIGNFRYCKFGYVSEIDQFLQELDQRPGIKSDERLQEEQKYQRIFALRDNPQATYDQGLRKDF